jgi:hypothetical protein
MIKANGTGQHAAPAHGNGALVNGNDPTVVHVNFGLKPRHIYAILAGIPAGLAALGAAGYAVMPASKAEVTAIQQGFQELKMHVTTEISTRKNVHSEIIGVVRELKDAVSELRSGAPQVAPRVRTLAPPRPKASPAKIASSQSIRLLTHAPSKEASGASSQI